MMLVSHHLHLSGCTVVTCEYVGHLMFSLHIERYTFLGIYISFLIDMSVWCSCLWSLVCCDASFACLLIVMPCHLFFHPCLFSERACVNFSVYSIKLYASLCSLLHIPLLMEPHMNGTSLMNESDG